MEKHLKRFEAACRKAGLKITHQRTEIFKEVCLADDHPTAEMLHHRLRDKLLTISLDTVYRTLTTLSRHNLVNRVETAENLNRFEVITSPHHHLICSKCNSITDFAWPDFHTYSLKEKTGAWGEIRSATIVVHGICRDCLHSTADDDL